MTSATNKPVVPPKTGQLKIYEEGVFFWSWKPYDVVIDSKTNHLTVTHPKTKETVVNISLEVVSELNREGSTDFEVVFCMTRILFRAPSPAEADEWYTSLKTFSDDYLKWAVKMSREEKQRYSQSVLVNQTNSQKGSRRSSARSRRASSRARRTSSAVKTPHERDDMGNNAVNNSKNGSVKLLSSESATNVTKNDDKLRNETVSPSHVQPDLPPRPIQTPPFKTPTSQNRSMRSSMNSNKSLTIPGQTDDVANEMINK